MLQNINEAATLEINEVVKQRRLVVELEQNEDPIGESFVAVITCPRRKRWGCENTDYLSQGNKYIQKLSTHAQNQNALTRQC